MNHKLRATLAFAVMAALLMLVGFGQSWSLGLAILNLCLISAIMALGVNIQWGYAGLFNVGIMGFAALGGIAAVLVSKPPVPGAWAAGGVNLILAGLLGVATIAGAVVLRRRLPKGGLRLASMTVVIVLG